MTFILCFLALSFAYKYDVRQLFCEAPLLQMFQCSQVHNMFCWFIRTYLLFLTSLFDLIQHIISFQWVDLAATLLFRLYIFSLSRQMYWCHCGNGREVTEPRLDHMRKLRIGQESHTRFHFPSSCSWVTLEQSTEHRPLNGIPMSSLCGEENRKITIWVVYLFVPSLCIRWGLSAPTYLRP